MISSMKKEDCKLHFIFKENILPWERRRDPWRLQGGVITGPRLGLWKIAS